MITTKFGPQNWIKSPPFDLLFVFLPLLICLLMMPLINSYWPNWDTEFSFLGAFLFFIAIDGTHVLITIRLSYLNSEKTSELKRKYLFIPIFCLLISSFLYAIDPALFFLCLSYFACYHFMRQQYGLCALYSNSTIRNRFDKAIIYMSTIVPMIYWHLFGKTSKSLIFADLYLIKPKLSPATEQSLVVFLILASVIFIALYVYNEIKISKDKFNFNKNIFILFNLLIWSAAFVYFDNIVFAAFSIQLTHGITYLGLVYLRQRELVQNERYIVLKDFGLIILSTWIVVTWIMILTKYFGVFNNRSPWVILFLLPTLTHYVLDGYVWRRWRPLK